MRRAAGAESVGCTCREEAGEVTASPGQGCSWGLGFNRPLCCVGSSLGEGSGWGCCPK